MVYYVHTIYRFFLCTVAVQITVQSLISFVEWQRPALFTKDNSVLCEPVCIRESN